MTNDAARNRFRNSLDELKRDIESDEDVMDFLDTVEVISNNLASYFGLKSKKLDKSRLQDVLLKIAAIRENSAMRDFAEEVGDELQTIRKSNYADIDGDEIIEKATELKDAIHLRLSEWFP